MRAFPLLGALVLALAGCVQPETEAAIRWAAPEHVEAGVLVPVAWEVEGLDGERVTHADVHAGPVAVRSPKASSYPLRFEANNRTGPDMEASLIVAELGDWYLRPHMVVDGKNVWGRERKVEVTEGLAVRPTMPAFVRLGAEAVGTYAASRPVEVDHADLHRADTLEAVGREASNGSASLAEQGELAFPAPPVGWGAYRMHYTVEGREYWSAPFEITTVDLAVRLVDPPAEVPAGAPIRFTWAVEGSPVVLSTHTGIHFASESWDRLEGNVTVESMSHEGAPAPVALPGTFTVEHSFAEPGPRFLRAHVRLGGGESALDLHSDVREVAVT